MLVLRNGDVTESTEHVLSCSPPSPSQRYTTLSHPLDPGDRLFGNINNGILEAI